MSMSTPMANYAAARRVGDFVFMSGVVAVVGQMSVDVFEAPIVAQSWFVLERIRELATEHGGTMADVVKLVQNFRHLHHYAPYNRVRGLFFPGTPPVSTVVEVARFLPSDDVLVEVEATLYRPQT